MKEMERNLFGGMVSMTEDRKKLKNKLYENTNFNSSGTLKIIMKYSNN